MRGRRPEQSEDPVAGEVFDRASELLDGVHHPSDGLADDEPRLFGIEALGERRRTDQVRGERRDDAPLFPHGIRAHVLILRNPAAGGPGGRA